MSNCPTRPLTWGLLCLAVVATGCGGANFQRAPGAMVYRPLPRATRILVAARIDQLPQPSAVLGTLSLKPTEQPGPQNEAIRALVAVAPSHGCDALAEVVFARTMLKKVVRQRVVVRGRVRYRNVVHKTPVTQWTARCMRTKQVGFAGGTPAPDAPAKTAPVAARPAAGPARTAARPAARDTRRPAARPAARAAAKASARAGPTAAERRAAAAAERKQRTIQAAKTKAAAKERKRLDAERLAKEADAAAAQRKAAEAAERDKARKAAGAAARVAARKNYEARVQAATGAQNPNVQVKFLAQWPDRPESAEVYTVLQQTARAHSDKWVKSTLKSTRTEKGKRPRDMDEARVKDELKKAGADSARFVITRSATYKHVVRNPTAQPALFELEANGARLRVAVPAGRSATALQTVDCGTGGAVTRKKARGVLELRIACGVEQPATITAMIPVGRETGIDRGGLGDGANLAAIGAIFGKLPTTRAVDLQLATIDAILGYRRAAGGGVNGSTKIVNTDKEAGMIDVKASLTNRSGRDVTAVFDAGTGRLTRLPIKRNGTEAITLPMALTVVPKLTVKDVLPRLRTQDWLPGHWRAGDAVLVVLPQPKQGYVAFAIAPKGDGTRVRVSPVAVRIEGARVIFEGKVPLEFAREGLSEAARRQCAKGCAARLTTKLTSLGKFEVAGPREMGLMLQAGGAKASITFRAAR